MEFNLTKEEQIFLLSAARESIISELERRSPVYKDDKIETGSVLLKPCGAFVTLQKIDGSGKKNLRGCIGRMTSNLSLLETIRMMAKEAAFGDPRFPRLKPEELSTCKIEISVLSPMVPCFDPQKVEVGVHGLYLRMNGRSGVLLPQVPVEQGWDRQEYLDYICIKAGLPEGSYKKKEAELLTFTAVVFGE